jgi:hypothetical protein
MVGDAPLALAVWLRETIKLATTEGSEGVICKHVCSGNPFCVELKTKKGNRS